MFLKMMGVTFVFFIGFFIPRIILAVVLFILFLDKKTGILKLKPNSDEDPPYVVWGVIMFVILLVVGGFLDCLGLADFFRGLQN